MFLRIQAHYPRWAGTSAWTETFPAQPNVGQLYQQVCHDLLTFIMIDNLD